MLNSTHKLKYGVEIRAGIKNISLFSSDGLNNSIKNFTLFNALPNLIFGLQLDLAASGEIQKKICGKVIIVSSRLIQ